MDYDIYDNTGRKVGRLSPSGGWLILLLIVGLALTALMYFDRYIYVVLIALSIGGFLLPITLLPVALISRSKKILKIAGIIFIGAWGISIIIWVILLHI